MYDIYVGEDHTLRNGKKRLGCLPFIVIWKWVNWLEIVSGIDFVHVAFAITRRTFIYFMTFKVVTAAVFFNNIWIGVQSWQLTQMQTPFHHEYDFYIIQGGEKQQHQFGSHFHILAGSFCLLWKRVLLGIYTPSRKSPSDGFGHNYVLPSIEM